jgi:hypothetical protein
MKYPSLEVFNAKWQASESITEVSVKLIRAGYVKMTPREVQQWSRVLRAVGLKLKKIARPAKLPFFSKLLKTEHILPFGTAKIPHHARREFDNLGAICVVCNSMTQIG